MNREEAIRCLSVHSSTNGSGLCTDEQHYKAKQMAIQALSQEPTYDDECQKDMDEAWEQIQKKRKRIPVTLDLTPCDDVVSREAVYRLVDDIIDNLCENSIDLGPLESWGREQVMELPSVTQKSGEWRPVYQGDEIINYRCSECEFGNTFGKSMYRMNYCPNCGSAMKDGRTLDEFIEDSKESEVISERNMKMWEEIFKAEREE